MFVFVIPGFHSSDDLDLWWCRQFQQRDSS